MVELLERMNWLNIQIDLLKAKEGKLTVNEIWKLSDFRDELADIRMEISLGNLKEELS